MPTRYTTSTAVSGDLSVTVGEIVKATEIAGLAWAQGSVEDGASVIVSGQLRELVGGVPLVGFTVDLYFWRPGIDADPGANPVGPAESQPVTDSSGNFAASFNTTGGGGTSFRCRAVFRETLLP